MLFKLNEFVVLSKGKISFAQYVKGKNISTVQVESIEGQTFVGPNTRVYYNSVSFEGVLSNISVNEESGKLKVVGEFIHQTIDNIRVQTKVIFNVPLIYYYELNEYYITTKIRSLHTYLNHYTLSIGENEIDIYGDDHALNYYRASIERNVGTLVTLFSHRQQRIVKQRTQMDFLKKLVRKQGFDLGKQLYDYENDYSKNSIITVLVNSKLGIPPHIEVSKEDRYTLNEWYNKGMRLAIYLAGRHNE